MLNPTGSPRRRRYIITFVKQRGESDDSCDLRLLRRLGVSPDDITVVTADTGTIALGMGTFAARTAVNAGSSVHLAAREVADTLARKGWGNDPARLGAYSFLTTGEPAALQVAQQLDQASRVPGSHHVGLQGRDPTGLTIA